MRSLLFERLPLGDHIAAKRTLVCETFRERERYRHILRENKGYTNIFSTEFATIFTPVREPTWLISLTDSNDLSSRGIEASIDKSGKLQNEQILLVQIIPAISHYPASISKFISANDILRVVALMRSG